MSFESSAEEPVFGIADERRDFVVFTRSGGHRAERARVPMSGGGSSGDVPLPEDLPQPPARGAIRTLTLALDLLESTDAAHLADRLGRWRLEVLIAERAGEGTLASEWRREEAREVAVRLRGWGFSRRIRTSFGVTRASRGPRAGFVWGDAPSDPTATAEHLEAAYDLVRRSRIWGDRAVTVVTTARRSSFVAPVTDPTMGFADTESLFAAANETAPAAGVALAGWRVPGEPLTFHRVAEEIAAANLRLSLFPWLADGSQPPRWKASLEQGFERVRPWKEGRPGDLENVHSVGASWEMGANRLHYRRAMWTDGREADRVMDEVTGAARPHPSLAVQVAAARVDSPDTSGAPASESRHLGASMQWSLGGGWNLWTGARTSERDCGAACGARTRGVDAQVSRALDVAVDGRRLPVHLYAGGSGQRIANARPEAADQTSWSVGTGVRVTF